MTARSLRLSRIGLSARHDGDVTYKRDDDETLEMALWMAGHEAALSRIEKGYQLLIEELDKVRGFILFDGFRETLESAIRGVRSYRNGWEGLPVPERAAALDEICELIGNAFLDELLQLGKIMDEHLDHRGEVGAPEVRDVFIGRFRSAARRESRIDAVETQRIMHMIRSILLERVRAGELRFKEARQSVGPHGRAWLLKKYYERVRAPGRG